MQAGIKRAARDWLELMNFIRVLNIKQVSCFTCAASREGTIGQQLQTPVLPANHLLLTIPVPLCPWTWLSVPEPGSSQGVACRRLGALQLRAFTIQLVYVFPSLVAL